MPVLSSQTLGERAGNGKVEAIAALGAKLTAIGSTVDESLAAARDRAEHSALAFVHPFDDREVIAGQGGLGVELLGQVPELARVVVPVGGGGLISGVATAVKSHRPEIEVIGVQVETCARFPASLAVGSPVAVDSALTIADGIAVKCPGMLTLALIKRWVDQIVLVAEDEGVELHVRETAVQLVLETRGMDHAQRVIEAVRSAGYPEPLVLRASK